MGALRGGYPVQTDYRLLRAFTNFWEKIEVKKGF